jgi:hypothetical protein
VIGVHNGALRPVRVAAAFAAAFAATITVTLAACGGPTPKKAADQRDRASSAATSAAMMAAAWDSGAAPGVYASHGIGEMSASLSQAESSAVWSAIPARQASPIRRELHALASITANLDSAIRRNDRPSAADLRGALLDHGQALTDLPIDTTR